jgi:protein-tyrosine-phosphatase
MNKRSYNVLFLCTTNSARSIMGEAIVSHIGKSRFHGFSAGTDPLGRVNPLTLDLLRRLHLSTAGLRSKSWSEFAVPNAPHMDFLITVCDRAAGELCPEWPGNPITARWGISDPVAVGGSPEQTHGSFPQRVFRARTPD